MIIFHFLAHPRKKEKKREEIETRKPRIFSRSIDRGREYEEEGSRKVELKLIPSLFLKTKERSFELPIFPSFDVSNRVVDEEQTEKIH